MVWTVRSIAILTLAIGTPPVRPSQPIDFARDIQPILAKSCLECHGAAKQKGGLRLDVKSEALKGGEGGPPVVAGKSAASLLIRRVSSSKPAERMPPKGVALTAEQIDLLRAWIDAGAEWPAAASVELDDRTDWWSLKPIRKPPLPTLSGADVIRSRNAIDAFVLAKMRERGLRPTPEADRRTLVRRLYFDLLGLPPSPAEVDSFVNETDPRAYEKLVDMLLASPHYGERWSRHWLDVVHYGDTHGYDKDQPRPNAWPYRDYVIRALNADMPYGRFVAEQIAGDVLFPNSADAIEALGFISAGPWDFIGHVELPESKIDGKVARHLDRDDMVANTIGTFVSLTAHCAQCHDHKFDPISQEDYYRLQAVFAAVDRTDRAFDADPAVGRRRQEIAMSLKALDARQQRIDARIRELGGKELAALDEKFAMAARPGPAAPQPEFGYHSGIESDQSKLKWVQVDLGKRVAIASVVLTGCHDDFNNIGAGFGFPIRFKIEACNEPEFKTSVKIVADQSGGDYLNPGTASREFDAKKIEARYVRVMAIKLAPRQNDFIFALAELEVRDGAGKNIARGTSVSALDSIEAPPRWGKQNLTDGITHPTPIVGAGSIERLRAERASLIDRHTGAAEKSERQEIAAKQETLRRDRSRLPPQRMAFVGAVHTGSGNFVGTGAAGGKPRPIYILPRGDVTKPGKEVGPGAIVAIPGPTEKFALPKVHREDDRRAALARWLTAPENPLTWRSIVNRMWLYHFGRGLVDTPNDFGRMGQLPSHPELLDWLAADFRDSGQSIKKLHRLIVTSATYRQATTSDPDMAKADASNMYYWRMNRRKLEAEAVRDSLLAVSGKLDAKLYGPAFQDFIVDKPEHSPHYEYQLHDPEDPRAHRRSVYRFIVRSQLQPFMAALDCADPALPVEKRNQSISPLQALALLNNQLAVVMAKHFAVRVEKAAPDTPGRIVAAYRLAFGRLPTQDELAGLTAHISQHGLASACRVIMNLNEFVFVD